jgi:hypothetical protein
MQSRIILFEVNIMSVIGTRHAVVPFVAGKTVAFPEQRLAKVGYKTTKKQAAKFPNVAVSIPQITEFDETIIERALPYLVTVFENAQDGIIRSLYESSDGLRKEIDDSEISPEACLAFLEAEANGSRLKKETIESWFDAEIADSLTVMIADKLRFTDLTPENKPVIAKHVNVYREIISSLAGGKTFLQPTQIKGCRVAIALCAEDGNSDLADKLIARLDAMENKPKLEELLDLE